MTNGGLYVTHDNGTRWWVATFGSDVLYTVQSVAVVDAGSSRVLATTTGPLRVFTRIRPRALLYLSALLATVSLVSMGLAKALDLRESIFMIPVAAGLTLIGIRAALLAKRRRKVPDTNNGVEE